MAFQKLERNLPVVAIHRMVCCGREPIRPRPHLESIHTASTRGKPRMRRFNSVPSAPNLLLELARANRYVFPPSHQ